MIYHILYILQSKMVKNNTGGNKAKGFARKNLVKRDNILRVAREEGEIYAQAVKIMGGRIASAIDVDGNPLRAHIRGKFSGRGKRDNFIGPGTWLLVGLHDWQSDNIKSGELKDCDILEVYNETDKERLKNSVTSVNWDKFIASEVKGLGGNDKENGFEFADEVTQEYEDLIAAQVTTNNTLIIDNDEQINVDDI
jgi:hypothetical protein